MQIFHALSDIDKAAQGCVVVIGNFDGVHRGHQAVLRKAKDVATQKGVKLAVLTFEPHPASLFRPDEPPFRLTPFDLKAERLEIAGVDVLFACGFNWDFASQSHERFIQEILKDSLQPVNIIVGKDFRFGQLRKGSPADIAAAGLSVEVLDEVQDAHGEKFSSSRIREFLRQGNLAAAHDILGWEWEIRGVVEQGDQRGRELGYPTANMALGDTLHPAYGVYAVRVQIEGEEQWRAGATNIGIRPMFEVRVGQVETYLFDFDREIYGKILRVRPVYRLRGEAKFNTMEELIAQIDKDCAQAREILK